MKPGSPEWLRLVTASKVPAILGLSPWESPRSLWLKMHGDLPDETQTDAQARGHYLEPAILAWWRDRHDEVIDVVDQATFHLDTWAAATPDAVAMTVDHAEDECDGCNGVPVLVEAKSTSRDDDWGTPGTDEIPLYYFVQVQWQMHVSGIHRCYVPMIGPRLQFAEYVVDYLPDDAAILEQRCREFYDSLSADQPPPLDDTVATWEAVRRVHPEIDKGETVELTADEAHALVINKDVLNDVERATRLAKSVVVDRMGRAQYATHNGVRIARRQPRGDQTTFVVVAKPADLPAEGAAA